MSYSLWDFLKLVGSLSLFLYGMQLMSSSLQKVAGSKMRSILSRMTSYRFFGVLTGFLVTAVVQSSSATTVMIVSFVNAGLLNLTESISLVMGANIGTTLTAWLISILGFKVKISHIALIIIGVCLPFLFSKNTIRKSWSETAMGFAILFIGLGFLKKSVPDIKGNSEVLFFLQQFSDVNVLTTVFFMIIGTVLTVLIQSSSATMALTLVLCNQGIIPFHLAAAMVLGENIGTTVTANLAAAVANTNAKRTARAHLVFNIIGVVLVLCLFTPFLNFASYISKLFGNSDPFLNAAAVPIALSVFHSVFNISNTMLQVWFVPQIASLVKKMVKEHPEDNMGRLEYISTGLMPTPELSLVQAQQEILKYSRLSTKSLELIQDMHSVEKDKEFNKLFDKIEKKESIANRIDDEIASYLTEVSKDAPSDLIQGRAISLMKTSNELESVMDSIYNIARQYKFARECKAQFSDMIKSELNSMHKLVAEAVDLMSEHLNTPSEKPDIDKVMLIEGKVNRFRDYLKKQNYDNIKHKEYSYKVGSIFNDLFIEYERMADFVLNVNQSLNDAKQH